MTYKEILKASEVVHLHNTRVKKNLRTSSPWRDPP